MATALFTHPIFLEHDPGPSHPESRARLEAVLSALEAKPFSGLIHRDAPRAVLEQFALVHDEIFVDRIFAAIPTKGYARVDPDTIVSPSSGEAALRAVGAVCAAVDEVVAGSVSNAFCASRPPGHHAKPANSMGFCLFNNVAIGAAHARQVHLLERVAVVDFDVHHGNGTQSIFESDGNLFYASTHQSPSYPGTGNPNECGVAGNIVNVTLRPGDGSDEFRAAVTNTVLPKLRAFWPELLMISAGFDAHRDDPLAQLNLETDDFTWITSQLMEVAAESCAGRVVSVLEGGYNVDALAAGVAAHVRTLMGS